MHNKHIAHEVNVRRARRIRTQDEGSDPSAWDYVTPSTQYEQMRRAPFDKPEVARMTAVVEAMVGHEVDLACSPINKRRAWIWQVMPDNDAIVSDWWVYWLHAGQQWHKTPAEALANYALGWAHWKAMRAGTARIDEEHAHLITRTLGQETNGDRHGNN